MFINYYEKNENPFKKLTFPLTLLHRWVLKNRKHREFEWCQNKYRTEKESKFAIFTQVNITKVVKFHKHSTWFTMVLWSQETIFSRKYCKSEVHSARPAYHTGAARCRIAVLLADFAALWELWVTGAGLPTRQNRVLHC